MDIAENIPIGPKTTMRIGGVARYFATLTTTKDAEDVVTFAEEKRLPLVMLGGGSNTIFADGTVEAVVARIAADAMRVEEGIFVHVEAGKPLASLIAELAKQNLDLSPLTGIPGTVGGAIFGNAGQGFGGTWIGSFVKDVTFYYKKQWKTFSNNECCFSYRESWFKYAACEVQRSSQVAPHPSPLPRGEGTPIIWSATLSIPMRPKEEIQTEIERLILKRIETQPHLKTAGSCFKSLSDGTPAWKLVDAAGLRGRARNDVQIAEKHANFLLNTGAATFADAVELVEEARARVGIPLDVEMRFIGKDGRMVL